MNKHIELVKKWLADKASVSQVELRANYHEAVNAAHATDDVVDAAETADAAWAAANAAWDAHATADSAFDVDAAEGAAYWVKEYEKLANEK